jgi:microcystin degradation protein MlrC
MPRVLVCECKQEISSFNPVPGVYEDFRIDSGEEVTAYHRGVRSEMGGALSVFERRRDVEIVPGYAARGITSGGTVKAGAFRRIAGGFLDAVRGAGRLDGIYFALHGALASEDVHDAEGYLLEETRRIVGGGVRIAASFDLHGILTDRILTHADVITVYHTYPHVDFYETGERAARLLLRLLDGGIRPVTARVAAPMLVRGYELITETGMFGRVVRNAIAVEKGPGGLSAGMFIGNPFTDVPDLCSNSLVVTDGDAEKAERAALSLARELWELRQHLQQPLTGLAESAREAASSRGRVMLVDAADATSSGAPGDSNAILRELVETGCRRTALIPIVDAPAAAVAFEAGVGATVRLSVGGSLDARFRPLDMEGRVRLLFDGRMRSESHGEAWFAGGTAVIESGPVTLVVTSRPVSLYDRTLFLACGLDPAGFDMTVVKSPHCQPRFFADGAERLINVDAPGAASANLPSLGHKRCMRPMFPLDEDVEFEPRVRLFPK